MVVVVGVLAAAALMARRCRRSARGRAATAATGRPPAPALGRPLGPPARRQPQELALELARGRVRARVGRGCRRQWALGGFRCCRTAARRAARRLAVVVGRAAALGWGRWGR